MRYEFRPLGQWADPETDRRRSSGQFKATWESTLDLLAYEIDCLDGEEPIVIQVDAPEGSIRRDGMLTARARVGHPGVAISFTSRFGPLRYATDVYEQQWSGAMPGWQANVRAIALALQALRAVDRYGVTKRGEQYRGWTAIEAPNATFADYFAAMDWMRQYAARSLEIPLGEENGGGWAGLYRSMAKRMHPDSGGSRADWDRLDEARRVLAEAGML